MKLYQFLAQQMSRVKYLEDHNRHAYAADVVSQLKELTKAELPRGSGFDNGSQLNYENTKTDRLVINTAFHHMDEHGSYDGWTEHTVIVTPSLLYGFELRVTGRNRNMIKEYISDVFHGVLNEEKAWALPQ